MRHLYVLNTPPDHGTASELEETKQKLLIEECNADLWESTAERFEQEIVELEEIIGELEEDRDDLQERISRTLIKMELLYETLNDLPDPAMQLIRKQLHYIREELVGDE